MDQLKTKNKMRKKFKLPTAFTILFLIIVVIVVISWILNGVGLEYTVPVKTFGEYDPVTGDPIGDPIYVDETVKVGAAGILDVFWSIIKGFTERSEVIVFVLSLGGFILVVMNTKALDAMTQALARKFSKRSIWLIPILMTFFSFCGTTYGMAEETLGFYMIVIPLMLSTGFDKITGLAIVLLGAGTGVMASTVNPFVVITAETAGGLNPGDGMAFRWIAWIVVTIAGIALVMWYAARVKKTPSKSVAFATLEEDKVFFLGEKQEEYPFTWRRILTLVFFGLTFIIMVVYLVAWDKILKNEPGTGAEGAGKWMNDNIPWLTSFMPGFGNGYLVEVGTFFFITALIVTTLNWKGEAKFVEEFCAGAKDLLGVCLVIATAAGIGVVLNKTNMNGYIVQSLSKGLENTGKTGFVVISFIIFLPLSFLIPSTSGFAGAIFPIWGPVAVGIGAGSGSLLAFSLANGLLNFFTPTSGVVMGGLAIARVDYGQYMKASWKYIAAMFVLCIVLLSLGSLLPAGTIF